MWLPHPPRQLVGRVPNNRIGSARDRGARDLDDSRPCCEQFSSHGGETDDRRSRNNS
jgi:hypothetical protein